MADEFFSVHTEQEQLGSEFYADEWFATMEEAWKHYRALVASAQEGFGEDSYIALFRGQGVLSEDDPLHDWKRPSGKEKYGTISKRRPRGRDEDISDPRILPCPTCGQPNRLTPQDRALRYHCYSCADEQERGSLERGS